MVRDLSRPIFDLHSLLCTSQHLQQRRRQHAKSRVGQGRRRHLLFIIQVFQFHFFHHFYLLNALLFGVLTPFFLNSLVFASLTRVVLQRRCCRRSFTASPHAVRQWRARHGHAASGIRRSRCYFSQRCCSCCRCACSPPSRAARDCSCGFSSVGREVIVPLIHACKYASVTRDSGAHSLGQPPPPLPCVSAHRL